MNQPTEDRIKRIEDRLEKLEQQTEPIKITRIEIEQPRDLLQEILRKQGEHERLMVTHSKGISNLQNEMQGARADIMSLKATQSDHGELLREHSKALAEIKGDITTIKGDLGRLETIMMQILDRLPQPPGK